MKMPKYMRRWASVASVPWDNPELLVAQYKTFAYQIPLMYVMLIINTWGVAFTHLKSTPRWLTVLVPTIFTVALALRAVGWSRVRLREPSYEIAAKALARTNQLAPVIAAAFTLWSLALLPYGDAYARAHVAFYMSITVLGVIFCLMHLRPAAIKVAVIVNGTFVSYFLFSSEVVFSAIAINTALVSITMLVILLIHYRDFTRMIQAQQENKRLANADSLTGLPNRRAFFSQLERDYAIATRVGHSMAVGIVDLDRFKPVNDIYGHSIGDKLLEVVGSNLARTCTADVHVARLGGDEFSILVSNFSDEDALVALGERLRSVLRTPIKIGDITLQVDASIGFACLSSFAHSATDLFENADYALYHSKHKGRSCVTVFSADHDASIRREVRVEHALRCADLESELSVAFQPIIDIRTGAISGFEALARWTSPDLGIVSPSEFIVVAERAGMVNSLTLLLLRKALTTAAVWPPEVRLAFNLSAQDLSSSSQLKRIIESIADQRTDAKRIDFEITETTFFSDFAQA
jgi:diguanylate cyclase (GGDEF)-like protein